MDELDRMPAIIEGLSVLACAPVQSGRKNLRVLVVEDDPSSRRALTSLLKLNGFEVTDVSTEADAIRRLDESPNCVLLDLMLPDGNGSTVLDHIRRHRLPIYVAITSGAANWESMLREGRPDAFFGKPLDVESIVQWLATHCGCPDAPNK
jgi:CheY-like chemotaxis protein